MTMNSWSTPARVYASGIGEAVADRTINRKLDPVTRKELPVWTEKGADPRPFVRETWEEVAMRVATGNAMLGKNDATMPIEFDRLHHHLRQGSVLMSGRHLQHTDEHIGKRNMEVLTNCSTGAASFIEFYLLLNGSGVGRSYDDDMMVVDWTKQPKTLCAIDHTHPDVVSGEITGFPDLASAKKRFAGLTVTVFTVPDSREGWAKAIEQLEKMTWQRQTEEALILDFTGVRHRGSPIAGMQNRPASGPGPLMEAIRKTTELRLQPLDAFEAAMHVDHYFAECVLVGGARRAARMATKTWRDKSVLRFIEIKRGGKLWSSNNSVTVDEEFWKLVNTPADDLASESKTTGALWAHANAVFDAICECSYHDGTGEPGLINVDKLTQKDDGVETLFDGDFAESERFKLDDDTKQMMAQIARVFAGKRYNMITNPCGEIPLTMVGGYCVIADVVPYHADQGKDVDFWDDDAEDAFRTATRALMRVNTMDCLYGKEVKRTNRIGIGFTGIHEYAFTRFGYGWKDLVNEAKSIDFWRTMSRFSNAIVDETHAYAALLGVNVPHTSTTVKPAGCATPDTTVVTTEGALSLGEVFTLSGYGLDALKAMPDGTWLEPTRAVQVLDENNEPKDITKLYVNGVKEVYEIAFEDGHTVKLTGNHKLKLTTGEWKRVDELAEEDDVASF